MTHLLQLTSCAEEGFHTSACAEPYEHSESPKDICTTVVDPPGSHSLSHCAMSNQSFFAAQTTNNSKASSAIVTLGSAKEIRRSAPIVATALPSESSLCSSVHSISSDTTQEDDITVDLKASLCAAKRAIQQAAGGSQFSRFKRSKAMWIPPVHPHAAAPCTRPESNPAFHVTSCSQNSTAPAGSRPVDARCVSVD